MTKKAKRNSDYRRDRRSKPQYKKMMKESHKLERRWGRLLKIEFSYKYQTPISLEKTGADMSGEVIEELKECAPDFRFHFQKKVKLDWHPVSVNKRYIEVTTWPEYCKTYTTVKVSKMKMCSGHQMYGKKYHGDVVFPQTERYFVLSEKTIKHILSKPLRYRHAVYDNFAPKPAIRLFDELNDLDLLESYEWTSPQVISLIEKHKKKLTMEKGEKLK